VEARAGIAGGETGAGAQPAELVRRRVTAAPRRLRVVLGEDSLLFREGLVSILSAVDSLELAGIATTEAEVLESVSRERPDVLVTDVRMPPTLTDEGIRIADRLRTERPAVGVVVLSQFTNAAWAVRLFQGGAAGRAYMLKEHVARRDQLVDAVREVADGGSYVDPSVVETLVTAHVSAAQSPLLRLTARQRQVLALIAEGMSNASIGTTLDMPKRAVERYVGDIFTKLELEDDVDVSRRVAATLLFLRETTPAPG
jgi:DNA-binding NarL/FixJ family response regulator